MSVERRGQVIRVSIMLVNWQQEEPTDCGEGRQLFMDDKSRVSREAQARFREGLGVQFPGATRPATNPRCSIIPQQNHAFDDCYSSKAVAKLSQCLASATWVKCIALAT